MKKISAITAIVTFTLASITFSYSQVLDNASKDIFVVKNTSGISFPFSSNSVAFNFTGSMNKSDSFFISKERYDRLQPTRGKNQYIKHPSKTGVYLRVRERDNRFVNYYLKSVVVTNLKSTLPNNISAQKVWKNVLQKDWANDLREIDQLSDDEVTDLLKGLDYIGITKGWYTVTDMGRAFKPIFVNLKISNLNFKLPGEFFTEANQPTITAEIGFVQNAALRFDNWNHLSKVKTRFPFAKEYDLFYSFFVNANCIRYYDTLNKITTPTTFGSIGKFLQFGGKINTNLYYTKWLAVALTFQGSYGLPVESFKNFQRGASGLVSPSNPNYFILSKAAGKYGGDINNRIWNGRFSLGLPIFLNFFNRKNNPDKNGSGSVYIVPSWATFGVKGGRWNHQLGFSANVLSKPYGGINSSIVQSGGIGFDFVSDPNMKTGFGSAIIYITGSFNLGNAITQLGKPAVK